MTKSELAAKMQDAGAWLPGKTVKLDFGDEGMILLDGANNLVSETDAPAETTIKVSWDDWQAMADAYTAEHPNVTINITVIENEAFKAAIQTNLQAGDVPDLFQSWGGGGLRDAEGGLGAQTVEPVGELLHAVLLRIELITAMAAKFTTG